MLGICGWHAHNMFSDIQVRVLVQRIALIGMDPASIAPSRRSWAHMDLHPWEELTIRP